MKLKQKRKFQPKKLRRTQAKFLGLRGEQRTEAKNDKKPIGTFYGHRWFPYNK